MKLPWIAFNLCNIHFSDDVWIDIAYIETEHYSGSLFAIRRLYDNKWEFDLLYYHLVKQLYLDWRERNES